MNYTDFQIWTVIALLATGTFLIRFSFLGAFGKISLPDWAQRLLRYTPVAVIPGLTAPLVLWPAATNGDPDAARIVAALVTLAVGIYTKNVLKAMFAGALTLLVLLNVLA